MRYPDAVTVLRASGTDEYGNPSASWDSPQETAAVGFLTDGKGYFPPGTDLRTGDRLRVGADVYDVVKAKAVRSPNRAVMVTAELARLPGGLK